MLQARPREAFWSVSCENWHVSTLVHRRNSHSCGASVLLGPGKNEDAERPQLPLLAQHPSHPASRKSGQTQGGGLGCPQDVCSAKEGIYEGQCEAEVRASLAPVLRVARGLCSPGQATAVGLKSDTQMCRHLYGGSISGWENQDPRKEL